MFKKVLIANRGEIAVRVIRACRELGIATVAVYSQADAHSLHVSLADEAYCIGPAQSAKSYLHIPALISVALTSGADAIHPGYGFLSERADFVDICEEHHIKFIGPSANAMQRMGDKATARATMEASGVPITPGLGIVQDTQTIREFVKKVGYPIIIKQGANKDNQNNYISSFVELDTQNEADYEALRKIALDWGKETSLAVDLFDNFSVDRHKVRHLYPTGLKNIKIKYFALLKQDKPPSNELDAD